MVIPTITLYFFYCVIADKHAKELAQVAAGHQKLSGDLQSHGAGHCAVMERVGNLEKAVVDTTAKQDRDARATKAKFESLSGRLSAVKEAWGGETPRP